MIRHFRRWLAQLLLPANTECRHPLWTNWSEPVEGELSSVVGCAVITRTVEMQQRRCLHCNTIERRIAGALK